MRARVRLVTVPDHILSSYARVGGSTDPSVHESDLRPLADTGGGLLTPDACAALVKLDAAVRDAGGSFRVTDCYRPCSVQAKARRHYEGDGGPYVARPGYSFHGAGRAVDVHVQALGIPWADYRAMAEELGWRFISSVKGPDDTEAWHIDYMGPWTGVFDALGYGAAAMSATLDIGIGDGVYPHSGARLVQSQLWRLGYPCGDIDGLIGAKTTKALSATGYIGPWSDSPRYLFSLAPLTPPVSRRKRRTVTKSGA